MKMIVKPESFTSREGPRWLKATQGQRRSDNSTDAARRYYRGKPNGRDEGDEKVLSFAFHLECPRVEKKDRWNEPVIGLQGTKLQPEHGKDINTGVPGSGSEGRTTTTATIHLAGRQSSFQGVWVTGSVTNSTTTFALYNGKSLPRQHKTSISV